MTRTSPKKTPGRGPRSKAPGGNRTIGLALAGLTGLVIVVIALFAVFSATGSGSGDAGNFTPNDDGLIPVGDRAPSFTADTVDGGNVSVGGGGQATMLVFFATWCPHCQAEAPTISELEEQYDDLNVVMVGIDGEDDAGTVRQFAGEYGIQSPAVYVPSLGARYQVSGYPTAYVLDGENRVVGAHSGEAPRGVFEGWIEEAL